MTLSKVMDRIESILPVTYRAWPENQAPELPYACVMCGQTNTLPADGGVYYSTTDVAIEVYCKTKDPELESRIEAALDGITWSKDEEFIDSEDCNQIIYEIEV